VVFFFLVLFFVFIYLAQELLLTTMAAFLALILQTALLLGIVSGALLGFKPKNFKFHGAAPSNRF